MSHRNALKAMNQRPIAYYPIYRQITGSTTAGILLSQLMYWFSKKDKFYKTDADIISETLLTEKELKLAKSKIKKLEFVTVTREGIPAKTYYEIDWEKFAKAIEDFEKNRQSSCVEKDKTDSPKRTEQIGRKGQTVKAERDKLYTKTTSKTTSKTTTNKEKFNIFIEKIHKEFKDKKLLTFKSKINKTKETREAFELISDDDIEDVIKGFAQYVADDKNMAARLDKFILAYIEGNIDAIQYGGNTPTIVQKGRNNGVSTKTKANIPIAQVLAEYSKDRENGATKEIATLHALEKVDWGLQKKLKEAIDSAEYRMYQSQLNAAPLDILDKELPF